MQTQTSYFRQCVRRKNHVKNFTFDAAMKVASYPKLLLECFIRSKFGVRYFSLAANLTVAFILAVLPVIAHKLPFLADFNANYNSFDEYNEAHSLGLSFWLHYGTWYVFLCAFLYFTWKRWQEIRHKPGIFDTSRYSLSTGFINEFFFRFHPAGLRPSVRSVETFYEPVVFFLAGLVLSFLGQRIGSLLMVSSVFYSLSYLGAYWKGDNFFLDQTDQRILSRQYEDAFINGNYNNAQGVRYYMSRPGDPDLCRELKGSIVGNMPGDEDPTFVE